MPKRYAFTKTEEFTGWVCSECGWQHKLPLHPSEADLAAAERAMHDHLMEKHPEAQ